MTPQHESEKARTSESRRPVGGPVVDVDPSRIASAFRADARPRASGLQADHECGSRINEPSPELEDDAGGPGELRGGDKRSGGVREAVTESGDRLEYVFDDHIPGVRLDPRVLLYGCTCSSPRA